MAQPLPSTQKDLFQALYEVAKTVNSTLSIRQVLDRVVASAAHALDAKACSLRLLNDTRDTLDVGAVYGLSDAYLSKGEVQVQRSAIKAEVVATARPVIIRDIASDPRLQYPEEAVEEGIRSVLAVPVLVKGTVIGVLSLYKTEPWDFSAQDVEFLSAIGNLSGIALENARVFEALEEQFRAIRQQKIPWAENFQKPTWR